MEIIVFAAIIVYTCKVSSFIKCLEMNRNEITLQRRCSPQSSGNFTGKAAGGDGTYLVAASGEMHSGIHQMATTHVVEP